MYIKNLNHTRTHPYIAGIGMRPVLGLIGLIAALTLSLAMVRPVRAADVVVQPPCSEAALRAAVSQIEADGGGSIALTCTAAFTLTRTITVTAGISLTIAGDATLGSSGSRFFVVEPMGALTLSGLTLIGGHAAGAGGAIYSDGRLVLENLQLLNNVAAEGGAVAATGPVEIRDSHFEGNRAVHGGALQIGQGAILTVTNSTFVQNEASVEGGALNLAGNATLIDTSWTANHAPTAGAVRVLPNAHATLVNCLMTDGSGAESPALFNSGEAELSDCTITNMKTVKYGAVDNDGLMRITNSIFLDNQSVDANSLHNHTVTPVTQSYIELTHVTMLSREAGALAEVINNGTLMMSNTVINGAARYTCYQGEAAADPKPKFISRGGNVLSDDNVLADRGCFATHSTLTDRFGGAPLDVATDRNGKLLVFPSSTSPAVDGATCLDSVPMDLRGVKRPQGDGCDSGAVEVRPAETFYWQYLPKVVQP